MGVPRNKLYHWYFETHMRHNMSDKISGEEKVRMQQYILDAIKTKEIEDINFQNKMKASIFKGRNIHRAEFSMTFNNLMRTKRVKGMLIRNNIKLPTRKRNE